MESKDNEIKTLTNIPELHLNPTKIISKNNTEIQKDTFIEDILNNCLVPAVPNLSRDILISIIIYNFSELISIFKLTIRNRSINIYSFIFAESGTGKGLINKLLKLVIKPAIQHYKEVISKKRQEIFDDINRKALSKFPGNSEVTIIKRNSWIEEQQKNITNVIFEQDLPRTGASFIADAEASQNWNSGLNIYIDEIANRILALKQDDLILFKIILELYDGTLRNSSIKQEKDKKEIEGIIVNFLGIGSAAKLLSSSGRKKFFELLEEGLGRRCLFAYQEPRALLPKNDKLIEEKKEYAKNCLSLKVFDIVLNLSNIQNDKRDIKISPAAEKVFDAYNDRIFKEHQASYNPKNTILNAELVDRKWKAEKVAGIISVINHSNDLTIYESDALFGIKMTDESAKCLERIIKNKPNQETVYTLLKDYFLEHLNEVIPLKYIRENYSSFNLKFEQSRGNALKEIINELSALFFQEGYSLECSEGNQSNATFYTLIKIESSPELDAFIEEIFKD